MLSDTTGISWVYEGRGGYDIFNYQVRIMNINKW